MKRVLIITYYWPPSGGIGVHRCLKFAKYLRNFGWEPVIYTAKDAQYPYFDDSNFKHIPENITVLKHKIIEPFNLFKFLSGNKKNAVLTNPVHIRNKKQKFIDKFAIWVRGNFFIPDARALWIKPSVKFLSKYLEKHPVDAILTDGPPHTNTMIGCKLAKKFNIPWLADFQDPWTQVDYYKLLKLTKWADKKHKKLEQEVFKTAEKITIASPTWKQDLEQIGAKNVDVIYWGYDEDDFLNVKKDNHQEFIISHAGLLGFDRNPETLLKVLKKIKDRDEKFANNLKIKLAGSIDYSVKQIIDNNGLSENTEYMGNISRDKAIDLIINSDILLLPINKAKNAKGRLPGKLYEYLRAYNPILALGPTDSDAANIIGKANAGATYEYDDYINIEKFIYRVFKKTYDYKPDKEYIKSFSNEILTGKIAGYLNEITK